MRSPGLARVAVAVWTRLLAVLRFLAVGPGALRRGWRLCFQVAAAGSAAALLTAGLAAVPAASAHAAGVTPADSAVSVPGLGGPAGAGAAKGLAAALARAASVTPAGSAVSVPGLGVRAGAGTVKGAAALAAATDVTAGTLPATLTASFDFTSYDAAETTAIVNNWWPEMLGLPDGSSLAQLMSGSWTQYQQYNPPSYLNPPAPADLSGATMSETSDGGTGSIVTFTVPTPSGVGSTTGSLLPPALGDVLADLFGALAGVLAMAVVSAAS